MNFEYSALPPKHDHHERRKVLDKKVQDVVDFIAKAFPDPEKPLPIKRVAQELAKAARYHEEKDESEIAKLYAEIGLALSNDTMKLLREGVRPKELQELIVSRWERSRPRAKQSLFRRVFGRHKAQNLDF